MSAMTFWAMVAAVFGGGYLLALGVGFWGGRVFDRGDFERGARLLSFARLIMPERIGGVLRLLVANYSGRTEQSVEIATILASKKHDLYTLNVCVNAFTSAGHYGSALQVGAASETAPTKQSLTSDWALLQTNLAEAEYNLGRWEDALARLERVVAMAPNRHRLAQTGERLQRAWILSHLGRSVEARESFQQADENALPHCFRAEYHYTNAVLSLSEHQPLKALEAVSTGLAIAKRASSHRNGLFLRARAFVAVDDVQKALADFECAAASAYRAQGRDGLLAWGDTLLALGRTAEAKAAWTMAAQRDPESASAQIALTRLLSQPQARG
jgi:tetratricopeptide (TPR) repeat protein